MKKQFKKQHERHTASAQDMALDIKEICTKSRMQEFADTDYIIVAAIDLGSVNSGYAFSTRSEYRTNPLQITSASWNAGTAICPRTATCVLFDPDGKFHSFGFEAENEYAHLALMKKHMEWFFFQRFKMSLYDKKKIDWNMHIPSTDGKMLSCLTVFTESIRYLKEQMLTACSKKGLDIHRPDTRWVVTVPAIWSDEAKQFMRKAAEKADIPGPQLLLAMEAEAAALYCRHLPADNMVLRPEDHISVFSPATKYVVLDVGGGTVDITVHQVLNDLTLKEVHKITGGNWGGLEVDKAFESLMIEVFGEQAYLDFQRECPDDVIELFRNFENKKRYIEVDAQDDIFIVIPSSLLDRNKAEQNISERIYDNERLRHQVECKRDKIKIKNGLAKSLFDDSLTNIKTHLKSLLGSPDLQDISAIIMVGGYSECSLLQKMVKNTFPDKKLIVPNEAGLAVLKGAVINGHEPNIITERICRHVYGIETCELFDSRIHPNNLQIHTDRGRYCTNVFQGHLRKNQVIPLFIVDTPSRYFVLGRNQKIIGLPIYISEKEDTKFVTELSCRKLGEIIVEMKDTTRGFDRGVDVVMTLGGAELQVQATDIHTGEKVFHYVDFSSTPSDDEAR